MELEKLAYPNEIHTKVEEQAFLNFSSAFLTSFLVSSIYFIADGESIQRAQSVVGLGVGPMLEEPRNMLMHAAHIFQS